MKIELEGLKVEENYFCKDKKNYKVTDILKISNNLEEFDLQIYGIDIGVLPWEIKDIRQFCNNMKRVNEVDMKYPVILDNNGYVCDGWHRIVKAIINGQETIKAKRLIVMPEPITE